MQVGIVVKRWSIEARVPDVTCGRRHCVKWLISDAYSTTSDSPKRDFLETSKKKPIEKVYYYQRIIYVVPKFDGIECIDLCTLINDEITGNTYPALANNECDPIYNN